MYDVIIIGAGPAGISSALYTKRAGLNVLVFYYGKSNLEKAEKIENYYGFIDGIDGKTLYENGIKQAERLGVDVHCEEVINIEKLQNFVVTTDRDKYESSAVIIATGNKKLRPNIKGIEEFDGKGISYCAICDGFFYRKKRLVVIGNGKYAIHEAEYLNNIAGELTILSNGLEMEEKTDIPVIKDKIVEIKGDTKVREVIFKNGDKIDVDGIFIAIGQAGGSDFAKKIGIMLEGDDIAVDKNMQTNIEGLYSCGDVVGNLLQVSKAVHDGAEAGIAASKYVKNKKNNKEV